MTTALALAFAKAAWPFLVAAAVTTCAMVIETDDACDHCGEREAKPDSPFCGDCLEAMEDERIAELEADAAANVEQELAWRRDDERDMHPWRQP